MLQKIIRKYGPGSNIILLGIVSFLTDASSEMICPLLPLFIMYLGGTGYAIGVIAGIGDSAASLLRVFSGYLSDKTGKRKPFVFTGYLVSSISKALYAASVIWQHILVLMIAERIGKGIRAAPRDAIIANSAPLDRMGWAFGVHRTMDSAGAILGTVLTIGILSYVMFFEPGFDSVYQCVFIIAGIIAFFGLIPLRWVREDDVAHDSRSMRASFAALPGSFHIYLAITTIFALGNFTYMFFILRASDVLLGGGAGVTGGASGAAQTGLNFTT
ncbi:MAG: MFS transporter, partial [Methanosarcinales archaeon]|nr:MFS transporter [Methanosarcinales archaeon]